MTTTFAELKTEVSEALRDPDFLTFDDSAVGRMVNMAVAEVGRISPEQFFEDITPVEDIRTYILRESEFSAANPDIEVMRVELWTAAESPSRQLAIIPAASSGRESDSEAGWLVWAGTLHIPHRIWSIVDGNEADYFYRVYGYSPYAELFEDEDVFNGTTELKWAVVTYAHIVAISRLVAERELFSQWQTRSGNSDITPAGLMGDRSRMKDEWRQVKRELYRHRTKV